MVTNASANSMFLDAAEELVSDCPVPPAPREYRGQCHDLWVAVLDRAFWDAIDLNPQGHVKYRRFPKCQCHRCEARFRIFSCTSIAAICSALDLNIELIRKGVMKRIRSDSRKRRSKQS